MRKKIVIGVVGHTGAVGSRVFSYFRKKKYKTLGVSRIENHKKKEAEINKLQKADIVFICVPTPFSYRKKTPDVSAVCECVLAIGMSKTVVIKSTVLPGTTERLQKLRPDLKLYFNPEFLSRKTARKDFEKPDRQIVGYTKKSKLGTLEIVRILPKGTYSALMKSTEAELVKYAHNVFGSMSITYANHLYDVSKALNASYSKIYKAFTALEDLKGLRRYGTIHHNKKRGFGGPCFPKDINSFLEFCKQIGVDVEIIQATRDANKRLLKSQDLDEQTAEAY